MRGLSYRDLTLLALTLLLPVPLVALVGHPEAVPGIGDGLGSLAVLDAEDERAGATARGGATESGSNERRPAGRTSRSSNAGGVEPLGRSPTRASSTGSASGGAGDATTVDRPPRESPTGDTPGDSEPGAAPQDDGASSTRVYETGSAAGIAVTTVGQGSRVTVGVSVDGVSVDNEADSAGAGSGSDESGWLGIEVTDTEGSSTGTRIGVPQAGPGPP